MHLPLSWMVNSPAFQTNLFNEGRCPQYDEGSNNERNQRI
jgi:hypothetical protein